MWVRLPPGVPILTRSGLMKVKETIEKAYGNIPGEPTPWFNLDWVATPRGVKYYWLKLIRVFTR
jgi:hypothetical protein